MRRRSSEEHTGEFVYRGETIPYVVQFRRRKDMAIHVHPDRRVTVDAPEGTPLHEVAARMVKRVEWIAKQRRYFDRFHPLPPEPKYVSGETHHYLGRQYRLKIVTVGKAPEAVKLVGRFLWVHVRSGSDRYRVQSLLDAWYRERARIVFSRRLRICLDSSKSLDVATPTFLIRKMVRRWGSCTRNKTILLNLALVQAPVTCIDYVIMHELCHLKVPNHGDDFFRLLSRFMPDWETRKRRLESFIL